MKSIDGYIALINLEKEGQSITQEDFCRVNILQIKEFMKT